MPSVCVNNCGLTVTDGALDLDMSVLGMKRECETATAYNTSGNNFPEYSGMRLVTVAWTNNTCLAHRVIGRMDVPWVRLRVGRGNYWFVRGDLVGSFVGAPVVDDMTVPELFWAANWYTSQPDGTDLDVSSPASLEHEWLVAPGDTLTVLGRLAVQTATFTARPTNLLSSGPFVVSLSAWPADTDGPSAMSC